MKGSTKTFTAAVKMGINPKAAASMRIRFLKQQLEPLLRGYSQKPHPILLHWIADTFEEIAWCMKKANRRVNTSQKNGIDDGMIEVARNADVRSVVDFKRGKAVAWCHEDKNPSLYYANRINRAICPVCDKKFSALDVLISRDGYSFIDAVRSLQ